MILDIMLAENVSAIEVTWVLKVPQNEVDLRNCDGTPVLFKLLINIFPDSNISRNLSTSSWPTFIKMSVRWSKSVKRHV